MSKKKARLVKQQVVYLGFTISQGLRSLGTERKEAICQTPEPTLKRELRAFLGMVGWCRLWIMDYGLIVQPLYKALKESGDISVWAPQCCRAFESPKRTLMLAPPLGSPNLTKPFELFVHERFHLARGVLAQRLGSRKRPARYFSKQLDNVSKGWPSRLRAVAVTVSPIREAQKLATGQRMTVYVPRAVTAVPEQKGNRRLLPNRMMKYQAILLEMDDVN